LEEQLSLLKEAQQLREESGRLNAIINRTSCNSASSDASGAALACVLSNGTIVELRMFSDNRLQTWSVPVSLYDDMLSGDVLKLVNFMSSSHSNAVEFDKLFKSIPVVSKPDIIGFKWHWCSPYGHYNWYMNSNDNWASYYAHTMHELLQDVYGCHIDRQTGLYSLPRNSFFFRPNERGNMSIPDRNFSAGYCLIKPTPHIVNGNDGLGNAETTPTKPTEWFVFTVNGVQQKPIPIFAPS
jgi:hypothetical protein